MFSPPSTLSRRNEYFDLCAMRKWAPTGGGGGQGGSEGVVDRDEIAFTGQTHEGFEVGLDHRGGRLVPARDARGTELSSDASARRTARRMGARGARWPIQISHC